MEFIPTSLPEVQIIRSKVHSDQRGFFMETFQTQLFTKAGLPAAFVQDNHAGSYRGILRGLHYQIQQAQGKLIRVVTGEIFDVVICSELLEHVPSPPSVLKESYRILRPGGILFICVPFMYQIHGDPYDFGRYTEYYWSYTLGKIGYQNIMIEKQGLFWSVLVGFLAAWLYMMEFDKPIRFRNLVLWLVAVAKKLAVKWDADAYHSQHSFFNSFTTGFGIRANK